MTHDEQLLDVSLRSLSVLGCNDRFPPRGPPAVCNAVLRHAVADIVYYPPFSYSPDDARLERASDVGDLEEFEELVARGDATRFASQEPVSARVDGCLYITPGNPLEYISAADASKRLCEYADGQNAHGDAAFARGDPIVALWHYELAAPAAQRPEDYERMLRCPLGERRRQRIQDFHKRVLAQSRKRGGA